MTILDEIARSYQVFEDNWIDKLNNRIADTSKPPDFADSYVRAASIQSWKSVLSNKTPDYCQAYIDEAQNDILSALILARLGSWRLSLKSLRSSLENAAKFIYYKDHSVEELQSRNGSFKFSFSDFLKYLEGFPYEKSVPRQITALPMLRAEYATLSKAVHSSGEKFRMSIRGPLPQMWVDSQIDQNQWIDREKQVLEAINLLFMSFFFSSIEGTKYPDQRIVISKSVRNSSHTDIYTFYSVRL